MERALKILIVEDESIVAMEIESYLTQLGYEVVGLFSSGEEALSFLRVDKADIVMMDICIEGSLDGVETAIEIKKRHPRIQTIFLTAHMDDYNVDRAVEADPVAYLAKPFHREELKVFMRIAERKIRKSKHLSNRNGSEIETMDADYYFNLTTQTLFCCNEPLHLTKKELMLLLLLIKNKNRTVDLYTIENLIWPEKETSTNTIRTLVKRLREKLNHRFIQTVSSRGYMLVLPEKKPD